jgi:hypothetical protein
MVWISESRLQTQMNSTDTNTHRPPTSSGGDNNQPGMWLAAVLPLLRYLNTQTLAFSLFVCFAFLNTTHGKDAQSDKPAAEVTNTEPRDNGYQGASAAAPLILWQFTARIVQAFRAALNDPALIEYARQQGKTYPIYRQRPARARREKHTTY